MLLNIEFAKVFKGPHSHSLIILTPETNTTTMSNPRCKYHIGNEKFVTVKEWKGELRVDLREWMGVRPTKKGISLTLMRWKILVGMLEYIDEALTEKTTYNRHLGGNVHCTVENGYVSIRQYWKPEEDVVPTRKGLNLRLFEYEKLKNVISDIGQALPELDSVVPCYDQSDHMNQLGAMMCSECNPDDFMNW